MARVSFFTEEGEKVFKLSPHRTFRIGRDPGNDAILRDAKVSRRHAEIIFERGFFVLHDLASSNGTFVNDRKIRVAPLTDGAMLRLGNSRGVFSEELVSEDAPTEEKRKTVPDAAHASSRATPVEDEPDEAVPIDPLPLPDESSEVETPPQQRIEGVRIRAEPSPRKEAWSDVDPRLKLPRYFIEPPLPSSPTTAIHDSEGNVVLQFTRPSNAVAIVARLVGIMIALTGGAVSLFLVVDKQLLLGMAALLLTAIFFCAVMLLIPRGDAELLSSDGARQLRAVEMTSRLALRSRVELFDAEGNRAAIFKRTAGSKFGARRWDIVDRFGGAYARVVEDPPSSAVLRKVFRFIRTNDRVEIAGHRVATLARRGSRQRRYDVDRADPVQVDPRIAVGIVLVTEAIEGR